MQELRQSTNVNIRIGPAVAVGDGFTPVTNLTIDAADEAEILKANTTATLAISGTLTAIANCDGWYYMTLTTGETDEIGPMTLVIQDDSAVLPIYRDFMVLEQGFFDTKYNSTGSMKASLTSAEYTTVTSFRATGFSTFDAANDAVSLGSATYTTVTSFQASSGAFSTFDPASDAVSLGSAIYTAIADFKATGFSTFDPAATGVTLGSATYTTVTSFRNSATAFSTFDPASDGVSLGSAVYTAIGDFKATGFSTFDPAASEVSISAASVDAIHDEVVEGTETFRQQQRIMRAALSGKSNGGSTSTINFRDRADGKNRIQATVDANGNRTAVTVDGA